MSQPGASPDARPDERQILDQLEALQLAIRATRATREHAEAAFDTHLRAFAPPDPARPADALPATKAGAASVAPPPVAIAPTAVALPKPDPSPAAPLFDEPGTPAADRPGSRKRMLAGAAGVLVLASFALFWTTQRGPDPRVVPGAATAPAAPVPARLPDEPAPVQKPVPAADPHALRIDLTSLRRVWLRVSVDGRIALEREVAGGEQLPFGADRSIVVRAGDAGAVSVRVGTDDQGVLGRDGQVITRAFTAPAR